MTRLALWAGPEATNLRIGARRVDQLASTGFAERLDDLDRLAALGVRAVRLPLLWERAETAPGVHDFGWIDTRLERCRALGLEVIAGLVHHGSGPDRTDLLDPGFVDGLAQFAGALAARHPWITTWTPVNEPLTTARFSALYGLWHPHRADDAGFVRALLHQVLATRAAMAAIRHHVPQAALLQTEDIGHTRGTPALADQVGFDNERRWLALDLLAGTVTPEHTLHGWLVGSGGTTADELADLVARPCPPDTIGVNLYVTSERFLDDRLERYPAALHGGNGRQRYADVEAVRVAETPFGGFPARLAETWARFRLPLAITEVQLGCTREEQLRWLFEAWQSAQALRRAGADIRAVTVWAAFGAHDWDSLLTCAGGHYESGLFDVRSGTPRPTALARLAHELAQGRTPSHPALATPGWWRRPTRVLHPRPLATEAVEAGAPLLIVGRGRLAQAVARACALRGLPHRLAGRDEVDIADPVAVEALLAACRPWAVVNAAGRARPDEAEHEAGPGSPHWRAHAIGPVVLAQACERAGARLLGFSSALVFDGAQQRPYRESDEPRPLNAHGRAKRHAEAALAAQPHVLLLRSGDFFGGGDAGDPLADGLAALRAGRAWEAVADERHSPACLPDVVRAALDLLVDGEAGLWHVGTPGEASWYDFACRAAEAAGLPRSGVHAIAAAQAGLRAPRPRYCALTSERGILTPALEAAIEHSVRALQAAGR